jgi:hypothetical protein
LQRQAATLGQSKSLDVSGEELLTHDKIRGLFFTGLLAFAACGGSSSDTSGGGNANVAGNWHGTISNGCAYTMNLTQNGGQVSGSYAYSCSIGGGSGSGVLVSGTISGQSLSLSENSPCGQVNMNATVSGSSFSGTWDDVAWCAGFGTGQTGNSGGSGSWSGTSP